MASSTSSPAAGLCRTSTACAEQTPVAAGTQQQQQHSGGSTSPAPASAFFLRSDLRFSCPVGATMQARACLFDPSDARVLRTDLRVPPGQPFSRIRLGTDAQRMLCLPNAGGNSVVSELLSIELLNTFLQARLLCTEMELEYFPLGSKITDYSVTLDGRTFGVSVTRAMKFKGRFTPSDAEELLEKKLFGVVQSSKHVLKRYRWDKQILHVFAEHEYIYDELVRAYDKLPSELRANTLVLVTVCNASTPFIFYDHLADLPRVVAAATAKVATVAASSRRDMVASRCAPVASFAAAPMPTCAVVS